MLSMFLGNLKIEFFLLLVKMKGQVLETIIGAFVLIIAGWFVFSVVSKSEDIFPTQNETTYHASFSNISGIKIGSHIRLAGINIGKVVAVSLDADKYMAEMVLAIDNKVKIPEDSEIIITSEGLLGSNFVSITPGGSEDFLEPNDQFIYTQGALDLNNLIQKFSGN